MKPIEFKEAKVIVAKRQSEYLDLPAFMDETDERVPVISCWGLSWKERIVLLFTGKIWLTLWSFGRPISPSKLSVNKPEMKCSEKL